ncbi:MAG: PadR family transcriptional regulator [Thaumarchaeota archaeon]|nr:PadR family transcriptional regulator [Nitrososphaerota archaeon]
MDFVSHDPGFELESIHGDSTSSHLVSEIQSASTTIAGIQAKGSISSNERMPDILRLEMLSLLHLKPLTGYELRKNIKASFNHEISFGTLYPNLASLERLGLIQGRWVSLGENQLRRKRIFTLTDMGKAYLSDNLDKLNKLTVTMQKMGLNPISAQ